MLVWGLILGFIGMAGLVIVLLCVIWLMKLVFSMVLSIVVVCVWVVFRLIVGFSCDGVLGRVVSKVVLVRFSLVVDLLK